VARTHTTNGWPGAETASAMFRSIRNQILIPIVAIQAVAVVSITVTAATLAARRMERQIVERLNSVLDALGRASFPYTSNVLERMQALSGAHFATYGEDGQVADTTLPALRHTPADPALRPASDRLATLREYPVLAIDGARYYAASLRTATSSHGRTLLVLYPETSWRQARIEAATMPLAVG